MRKLVFLIALSFSVPACAQDKSMFCQFWEAHRPAVGTAYQPGVDVHGNPVVPADINAAMPALLPSRISFPLTIDMAQAFDIPVLPGTKMDADMGMIDVYTDGRVLYNGQDMSAQALALCAAEKPDLAVEVKKEPPKEASKEPPKEAVDIIWGEGH